MRRRGLHRALRLCVLGSVAALLAFFAGCASTQTQMCRAIQAIRTTEGALIPMGEMERENGDMLYFFEDDTFRYAVRKKGTEVENGTLKLALQEVWERQWSTTDMLTPTGAQEKALTYSAQLFPTYKMERVRVQQVEQYDRWCDRYIVLLAEQEGTAYINEAWIGLGADGCLTSFRGSRYAGNAFDGSDLFGEEDIRRAIWQAYQDLIAAPEDIRIISMVRVRLDEAQKGIAWRVEWNYREGGREVEYLKGPHVSWVDAHACEMVTTLFPQTP